MGSKQVARGTESTRLIQQDLKDHLPENHGPPFSQGHFIYFISENVLTKQT